MRYQPNIPQSLYTRHFKIEEIMGILAVLIVGYKVNAKDRSYR